MIPAFVRFRRIVRHDGGAGEARSQFTGSLLNAASKLFTACMAMMALSGILSCKATAFSM